MQISGRVIVDAYAFYHCQDSTPPPLQRNEDDELPMEMASDAGDFRPRSDLSPISDERHEDLRSLTDIECILSVAHVKGFDLAKKQWGKWALNTKMAPIRLLTMV